MKNRFFIYIPLIIMFVFLQTNIALHAATHVTGDIEHSTQSGGEPNVPHELCEQCIANAQADTANVPTFFYLLHSNAQHFLTTAFAARLTLRLPNFYSVRAPPTSLIV